jgi:hypothetical protein
MLRRDPIYFLAKKLSTSLKALKTNNAKWMNIGAMQFTRDVARICKLQ